ncbi:ABC transporter transmembrane domain-containing protein [Pseudonocardia sp. TRM90224]|uniref:ABC transporter transmembrane domain-containing protein n=1 Tax=Pseudonocardia sp. TRM90224 TaxID=2812678 RepID=UPI001E2BD839|nr:ABC transporter ATP-binding protein [Pseudonocardia sp. TRM90224]
MVRENKQAGRLVRRSVAAGRWYTVATAAASVIGGLLAFALPGALAAAVDGAVRGSVGTAAVVGLALLLVGLVVTEVGGQYTATLGAAAITLSLRRRLLTHLVRAGVAATARFHTGDAVSRITANAGEVAGGLAAMTAVLSMTIAAAGGVVGLFLLNPWTVLVVGCAVAAGWVVARRFVADTTSLMTGYLTAHGTIATGAVGALSGIRTIRSAGAVDREVRRVLAPVTILSTNGTRFWIAQGRVSWQLALLMPAVEFGVLAIVGMDVASGRLGPGALLAAAGYAAMALGVLGQAQVAAMLVRARAGAHRMLDVLDLPAMAAGEQQAGAGPGTVVVSGVTVLDGGRTVLDGVDLIVPGGSSLAVVGAADSGKSALAAVVGRVVDPGAGVVSIDGADLRDVADDALADLVCTAFERPNLIGASIADALRFGSGTVTDADMSRGACAARADEFVRRLPSGYATALLDAPLSGGELQRLGLARAFARPARVLVLDDAMSSLDTVTEVHVSRAVTEGRAGRTTVVVGYRAGTAARCDRVAWLERGRIRRVAPHIELWSDPDYRALFTASAFTASAGPSA